MDAEQGGCGEQCTCGRHRTRETSHDSSLPARGHGGNQDFHLSEVLDRSPFRLSKRRANRLVARRRLAQMVRHLGGQALGIDMRGPTEQDEPLDVILDYAGLGHAVSPITVMTVRAKTDHWFF